MYISTFKLYMMHSGRFFFKRFVFVDSRCDEICLAVVNICGEVCLEVMLSLAYEYAEYTFINNSYCLSYLTHCVIVLY